MIDVVLSAAMNADVKLLAWSGGSAIAQVPQWPTMTGQHVPGEAFQMPGVAKTIKNSPCPFHDR